MDKIDTFSGKKGEFPCRNFALKQSNISVSQFQGVHFLLLSNQMLAPIVLSVNAQFIRTTACRSIVSMHWHAIYRLIGVWKMIDKHVSMK